MAEIRIEGHPVELLTDTGYDHLYLVFVADDGSEYVLRGGPSGPFGTGDIAVEDNVPIADSADARPVEERDLYGSRVLDLGTRAPADVWEVMRQQARAVGDRQLPFLTFTQNSNSLVASLLHVVGIDIAEMLPDQPGAEEVYPATDNLLDSFGFVLTGTPRADILAGGASGDSLAGGAGNDRIDGGAGHDTLLGGAGNDTVKGGAGGDLIFLGAGDDLFLDDDRPGAAAGDTVWGGLGRDSIAGGRGDDLLHGGTGNDRLAGEDGRDTVYGGDGRDLVHLGSGADLFLDNGQTGLAGRDTVWAGAGNDMIRGGGGADAFHGAGGNDTIFGGRSNDTLDGGVGDDRLTGGAGADCFVFTGGADRVTDFTPALDSLRLDSALWGGEARSAAELVAQYAALDGGNVVFDFGAGNVLTLEGVTDPAGLVTDLLLV